MTFIQIQLITVDGKVAFRIDGRGKEDEERKEKQIYLDICKLIENHPLTEKTAIRGEMNDTRDN